MRLKKTNVSGASVIRLLGVTLLAGTAAACSSDVDRFSYKNADQLYTASIPQPASDSLAPLAPVPPGGVGTGYPQAGAYPQAAAYPQAGAYPQAAAYPQAGAYPQQPAYRNAPAPYPQQAAAYPSQPAQPSQAFPGDYRAPIQSVYDNTSTGSVPGAVVRSAASPSCLIPAPVQRVASSMRNLIPSRAPAPALANPALTPQAAAARIQPALAAPTRSSPVTIPASVPVPQRQPVAVSQPMPQPVSQPFPQRPASTIAPAQTASIYNENSNGALAPDPITTGTAPLGAGWTTAGATRITLGPGETIYNLSKRYGVPASEIMKANDISDASKVSAGRQLLIPVYVYSRQAPVSAPDNNPKTRASNSSFGMRGEARHDRIPVPVPAPSRPMRDVAVLPTAPSLRNPHNASTQAAPRTPVTNAASNSGGNGHQSGVYSVKSGDTLTKIARAHGVSIDALKSANGLSGSNIRIGQKLAIPGPNAGSIDQTRTASVNTQPAPKPYTPPAQTARDPVAAKTKGDIASVAPASTGIGKFRWPARGQVITRFAQSENGKRNDGIDISMPTGTPIKAAENGVVIYSGDGLKEYGKTVLIRHDDGLVTVYAHANSLNVQRGDKIARGQVIASSGMTGVAKTPRLHFEVRKNASPVDPMGYLE